MWIMGLLVFALMLCVGVVSTGIRLAWGATKFVLGLGLFCLCPVLFVLAILLGAFSHMWLPILLVGFLCTRGFGRW